MVSTVPTNGPNRLSAGTMMSKFGSCECRRLSFGKAIVLRTHRLLVTAMPTDQSHQSHNASVPYPTIHHFGTEMCTFLFQSGVLWDMEQVHYGICETILLSLINIYLVRHSAEKANQWFTCQTSSSLFNTSQNLHLKIPIEICIIDYNWYPVTFLLNTRILIATIIYIYKPIRPYPSSVVNKSLHQLKSRCNIHYSDVIMSSIASQITSMLIVYSTLCSGTDQRKHQSSASLAFVRGIHRWPVNSPHKGPVTRKMFPFDGLIMICFKMA